MHSSQKKNYQNFVKGRPIFQKTFLSKAYIVLELANMPCFQPDRLVSQKMIPSLKINIISNTDLLLTILDKDLYMSSM